MMDRAELSEEELQSEEDSQFEAASAASAAVSDDAAALKLWKQEQELLDEMTDIAEDARHRADARTKMLIEWIREKHVS